MLRGNLENIAVIFNFYFLWIHETIASFQILIQAD